MPREKRIPSSPLSEAAASAVAGFIEAKSRGLAVDDAAADLATALIVAYPGLRAQIVRRPEDVLAISRGRLRIARDLRAYRRMGAGFVSDLSDHDEVRRRLRPF